MARYYYRSQICHWHLGARYLWPDVETWEESTQNKLFLGDFLSYIAFRGSANRTPCLGRVVELTSKIFQDQLEGNIQPNFRNVRYRGRKQSKSTTVKNFEWKFGAMLAPAKNSRAKGRQRWWNSLEGIAEDDSKTASNTTMVSQ